MNRSWPAAIAALVIGGSVLLAPAAARAQRSFDWLGTRSDHPTGTRPFTAGPQLPLVGPPVLGFPRSPGFPTVPIPPHGQGQPQLPPAEPPGPHRSGSHSAPAVVYVLPPPAYYSSTIAPGYSPPVAYEPEPSYAPAPYDGVPVYGAAAAYGAPATATVVVAPPAPPPPPAPRVIEYPTGRYELVGDGTTTPYSWAWIPTAPPPPPAPPSAPPRAEIAFPGRRAKVYRWLDEQSVIHFTDNLQTVPERFRAQARGAAEN